MAQSAAQRRTVGFGAAPPVLVLLNQIWSLDFVHDQKASGRPLRLLNIVDDLTRECPAAVPVSGCRVMRELTANALLSCSARDR